MFECASALLAAAMLCAAATPSASANWFVAGTELTGTAALATTAAVYENFKLSSGGITIECSGTLNSVEGELQASEKISASHLTFSGCKVASPCSVPESISTVPLVAELTKAEEPEERATFVPQKNSVLATIKFTGELCPYAGIKALTGKATFALPGADLEVATQVAKALLATKGELLLASSAAELTGGAELKLASGAAFGNQDGMLVALVRGATHWVIYGEHRYGVPFSEGGTVEFSVTNASATNWTLESVGVSSEANFKFVKPTLAPTCAAGTVMRAREANFCYFAIEAQRNHVSTWLILTHAGGQLFPLILSE